MSRSDPIYVLGISDSHDASAALSKDGELIFAIAEERLTRQKHHAHQVRNAVQYVLNAAGIEPRDVSCVVINSLDPDLARSREELEFRERLFTSVQSVRSDLSHHMLHAASAFLTSPFEAAAVLVTDGMGSPASVAPIERETVMSKTRFDHESLSGLYEAETWFDCLYKDIFAINRRLTTRYPYDWEREDISLGRFYSYASKAIFGSRTAAGKVMGLADFGNVESYPSFLCTDRNARFDYEKLSQVFGGIQTTATNYWSQRDLAARVQSDLESSLRDIWKALAALTSRENICVAGGVGLNCSANGKLAREGIFSQHYFFPASGDDGISIGAALLGFYLMKPSAERVIRPFNPYLGKAYKREEIEEALESLSGSSVRILQIRAEPELLAHVANILNEQKVVGWFQGGAEFGPRALGNRSILASPKNAYMREYINSCIKHREFYRPLAPVVKQEDAQKYFDVSENFESPFMLAAVPATAICRQIAPAVVHCNGTSRVQTVTPQTNSRLYGLISEFEKLSGSGVLLNTSLNGPDEPIVETPADAISCFLKHSLDALVVGDIVIERA